MSTGAPDVRVGERDGVLVLAVEGDLDAEARGPLLEGYRAASVRSPAREVLLDLARCAYINSTGIALVVGLLAQCRADGRRLSARGVTAHYRHLFDVTRISEHLRVLPDDTHRTDAVPI